MTNNMTAEDTRRLQTLFAIYQHGNATNIHDRPLFQHAPITFESEEHKRRFIVEALHSDATHGNDTRVACALIDSPEDAQAAATALIGKASPSTGDTVDLTLAALEVTALISSYQHMPYTIDGAKKMVDTKTTGALIRDAIWERIGTPSASSLSNIIPENTAHTPGIREING